MYYKQAAIVLIGCVLICLFLWQYRSSRSGGGGDFDGRDKGGGDHGAH